MCQKHVHVTPSARVYPPRLGELGDTFEACKGTKHSAFIYCHGDVSPHFSVPAIRYEAVMPWEDAGYVDMIYINDLRHTEDDPILCACWDFYLPELHGEQWLGAYQACYDDKRVAWYMSCNVWDGD